MDDAAGIYVANAVGNALRGIVDDAAHFRDTLRVLNDMPVKLRLVEYHGLWSVKRGGVPLIENVTYSEALRAFLGAMGER